MGNYFGVKKRYTDLEQLLQDPAVDMVHIKFRDSDVSARIIRSLFDTARQYRESIDVYGTKKAVEWPLIEHEPLIIHTAKLPVSRHHIRNFVDGIQNRTRTVCDVETALRSDTLCQLALIAVKSGRKLRWNPQAESGGRHTLDESTLLADRGPPVRHPQGITSRFHPAQFHSLTITGQGPE